LSNSERVLKNISKHYEGEINADTIFLPETLDYLNELTTILVKEYFGFGRIRPLYTA